MTDLLKTGGRSAAERLSGGVIVFDGAMGTMLHAAGASLDRCLPELNESRPALVASVHRAYLQAGADVIETNTFGANRITMARFGLADRVEHLNRLAVELARRTRAEIGVDALIAGSIGPAIAPMPAGRPVEVAGTDALVEQAVALEQAGAEILVFETFSDLPALEAVLDALDGRTELPIVAQMTFLEDGNTIGGDRPETVAKRLSRPGVVAVGANCTLGPRASRPIVEALVAATSLPVAIQPNAGPPVIVDGRFEYRRNEEYFASASANFIDLGATIVGGCCGTTPQHIDAVVRKLRSGPPRAGQTERIAVAGARPVEPPEGLGTALRSGAFVVLASLPAPDADDADAYVEAAEALTEAGADAVVVRPTQRSRTSMSPISFGLLLRSRLGIEPVLTASTYDKSLLGLQADLLGAHAFGLRSVICTTGTPPPRGDYPEIRRVFDADAIDLIAALRGLNGAVEPRADGKRPTAFVVGARVNPSAADIEWEIARTRRKLDAGIDFLVTDPIFSATDIERFVDAIGHDAVPILMGITALRDFEHAEFLHYETAGVTIPAEILDRMRDAGPDAAAVGRAIASEIIASSRPHIAGVVVAPARPNSESVRQLIRTLADTPESDPSASIL